MCPLAPIHIFSYGAKRICTLKIGTHFTLDTCFSVSSRSTTGSSDDDLTVESTVWTRCDMCRNIPSSLFFRPPRNPEPFTCDTCEQNHKDATNSCLCKGAMNDVIKEMISCEICQSWYHQSCVGVCNVPYVSNLSEPLATSF